MSEHSLTYREDRPQWGPGPWQEEPDKVQWTDPATGLPCLIVRGPSGALCGYVGVDAGHPWFGQDYDEPNVRVDVHGGLTYAALCQEFNPEQGVCHVPEPGQADHVWWFGFDCAHWGDHLPSGRRYGDTSGTYRDVAYVRGQVTQLAAQLAEVKP